MSEITLKHRCGLCGQSYEIKANKIAYSMWKGGASIQNAFPDRNSMERDAIAGRCCFQCFSKMYNMPLPGEEESYGKRIGECSCCGMAVWEKDIKEDGSFECKSCHQDEYDTYE